jgi:hypothetical protein
MKNVQKNSSKLEAPIALTPDQIAMVAAGSSAPVKGGIDTTRSGALPAGGKVAADTSVSAKI